MIKMGKLIIILMVILLTSIVVFAKLSDDTLKEVEKLKWKHSGLSLTCSETFVTGESQISYEWEKIYFEDGKLFVATEDGKWYIEMKKVEK